ncbi:MAG: hypothetical protein E7668_05755 [Ruminococcaceae bacterium]|nr:hypothetical protein [Oscillospiraceae bacterium]
MLKNMKKIVALLLAFLLLLGMVACGKDVEDGAETTAGTETSAPTPTPTPTPTPDTDGEGEGEGDGEGEGGGSTIQTTTTALNASTTGIKLLGGRTVATDSQINLDHSGSGIEFVLRNSGRSLAFEVISSAACRFKVFVDGELCKPISGEAFFEVNGKSLISVGSVPMGNHTVRLVRITDQAVATAQVTKVTYTGIISADTPDNNDLYIEFIGGTEAVGGEDVTSAYSYKLAEAMKADYAIVSMLTAVTGADDLSARYTKTAVKRDAAAEHGFARKADVVVIDLGALDVENADTEAFTAKYKSLVDVIRAKNGEDCKIVCVYRWNFGELGNAIQTLCRETLGGQQDGVYLCQMVVGEDLVLDATEAAEFVTTLQGVVDAAVKGIITEQELDAEESGDGLVADFNTFVPLGTKG